MPKINRREWVWLLIVTGLILLLGTLPYLAGYHAQTAEQVFSGVVFDRLDFAGYLATMHRGLQGEWQYKIPFTSEAQHGAYIRLPYIFLGHLARWTGLGLIPTWHLARLVLGLLACGAVYTLAAIFFAPVPLRRLAFVWAVMGSGLGWLQMICGWVPLSDISPMDFWLIDAYVFFGLTTFPHFAALTTLLTGMLVGFLSYLRRPGWGRWLLVALLGVLIQPINPYLPLLGDLALLGAAGAHWLKQRRVIWRDVAALAAVGAVQIPLLVYTLQVFRSNPIWRGFSAQAFTLSPPPIYCLWGFGLFWPFALLGGGRVLRRISPERGAVLTWATAAFILAYAPFIFQRRFLHTASLPLALLAVMGLQDVFFPWLERCGPAWLARRKIMLAWLIVLLASLSSFYLGTGGVLYVLQRPPDLFDPSGLVVAADWLAANAEADDVILSSESSGRLVAARTGLTVYLGHSIETLEYERKLAQVSKFFAGELEQASDWLRTSNCDWLVYGPYEQTQGGGRALSVGSLARQVYQNEDVVIFQLTP